MENESKVISESPEGTVPDVLTVPESAPGVENPIKERDEKRRAIEDKVIEENNAPKPPDEEVQEVKEDVKPESQDKLDDSLKKQIQKRINKEVAKRKTAEEELADLRAENQRLKESKQETASDKTAEPTMEQCEAYIVEMREKGNVKEEIAAMRYLVKLEKESAIKSIKEEQAKEYQKVTEANTKQQSDWISLNRDYESDNPELNLSNQNGLLYKEAMKLYQDPELSQVYSDPDRIMGFRKAVHDSFRYILERNLHKKSPSEVLDTTPRVRQGSQALAEPFADSTEEQTQEPSKSLSDADKVKDEILNRRKNLYKR